MKITKRNRFQIIDDTKLKQLKDGDLLLNKYPVFFNRAIGGVFCHNKAWGTKEDFEYGSNMDMASSFKLDKGFVEISCSCLGGMCYLTFDEEEIEFTKNKQEKELKMYVIKYIKDLHKAGIIAL